jgi:hypothetical protein
VVSKATYTNVFRVARTAAFTADVVRGPLAARPYDLRHAAVRTWLAGVPAATVAQSIAVLLAVYASFLDGGEQAARQVVGVTLGNVR